MVEVFKTNVAEVTQAASLTALLQTHFPDIKINIDLHDCDKVLRLEGKDIVPGKVMQLVEENGYQCEVLV